MTVATQGYMSPSIYGPSNMFASSGRNVSKNNDLFKTFGDGTVGSPTIEPQQTSKKSIPRTANMEPMNRDDSSFFDFEPSTNPTSPFRDQFSTPGASGMPWGHEANYHPLSPPPSASFSPKDPWAYPYQHQNPTNIFTNINPSNTRAQYGQVTPPDDETDSMSLLDFQLKPNQRQGQPQLPSHDKDVPAKKRKRSGQSGTHDQAPQPTKRSRKYASRVSDAQAPTDKPEDVKRSKFLERNRVAASKCRQKKKEWTQNLESRARDLQKNNNLLRMNVESLRDEVLFLKGEMLKHSGCDCEQIQSFVKSKANNFLDSADNGVIFKREQSPIESRPASPASRANGSVCDFGSSPSSAEQSNSSIVNDENALEALLASSINHDTSEEGIALQIAG